MIFCVKLFWLQIIGNTVETVRYKPLSRLKYIKVCTGHVCLTVAGSSNDSMPMLKFMALKNETYLRASIS